MTAYTVNPGHRVAAAPTDQWAPPTPSADLGAVYQELRTPSLDTLHRVLIGLRRLDIHPAHQTAPRLYGTPHNP